MAGNTVLILSLGIKTGDPRRGSLLRRKGHRNLPGVRPRGVLAAQRASVSFYAALALPTTILPKGGVVPLFHGGGGAGGLPGGWARWDPCVLPVAQGANRKLDFAQRSPGRTAERTRLGGGFACSQW